MGTLIHLIGSFTSLGWVSFGIGCILIGAGLILGTREKRGEVANLSLFLGAILVVISFFVTNPPKFTR